MGNNYIMQWIDDSGDYSTGGIDIGIEAVEVGQGNIRVGSF
jgi:hypothetical protein